MTDRPKVSVLVPTYRYAHFLPEAIDSILSQDLEDFELLISDDCSNDGSAEIIRRYAARDRRIRPQVQEKNLGMVAHWNWCLGQARGDYVKFLFGDDRLMARDALGRMAVRLDAEPRAVLAATARAILDEQSQQVDVWDQLGQPGYHRGADVIGQCLQGDRNLIGEPSAVLFRRAAAARGFDPAWRQLVDLEMWFHLLSRGDLVYDPAPLCGFRCHAAQQTAVNRKDRIGSTESMLLLNRYFDHYAAAIKRAPNCLAVRRFLFRHIYYSQKDSRRESRRTPELAAAEQALLAQLTPRWYAICWLIHRGTKPFANFRHFFRPRGKPGA